MMMVKGKFKVGKIKETKGQRKKHVNQMNEEDIELIKNRVEQLRKLYASRHVIQKIKNDNLYFTSDMVVDVLVNIQKKHIIEYNRSRFRGRLESRVLLRSDKKYPVEIKGRGTVYCNLCFVLALDRGALVTVYWNEYKDNHARINKSRYDKNLVVI